MFCLPCTDAVDPVDEGVVAAVAHGQPVEHKEHDVDVLPAAKKLPD